VTPLLVSLTAVKRDAIIERMFQNVGMAAGTVGEGTRDVKTEDREGRKREEASYDEREGDNQVRQEEVARRRGRGQPRYALLAVVTSYVSTCSYRETSC
jgi:hypothetical protein